MGKLIRRLIKYGPIIFIIVKKIRDKRKGDHIQTNKKRTAD